MPLNELFEQAEPMQYLKGTCDALPRPEAGNMTQEYANALPRKNFFIQMFTRDISLEDCLLDLIDNSIDGLVRSRKIDMHTFTTSILERKEPSKSKQSKLPTISVNYSEEEVSIIDNCGGFSYALAHDEAFNFGHKPEYTPDVYLGVFGIGMKRALFKIGNEFSVSSKTIEDGFECSLDVQKWLADDESPDQWRIPINKTPKSPTLDGAGTHIVVKQLHDEVKHTIKRGSINTILVNAIARTYSFYINRYVRIEINGNLIEPQRLPIGSITATAGTDSIANFTEKDVGVVVYASLANRSDTIKWQSERAGWYMVCNGRITVFADKTDLTGWGISGFPTYQPKHRGFIGLVFFSSENLMSLPLTTTKRGIYKESYIYILALKVMMKIGRPVIRYLDSYYPEEGVETIDNEIAKSVEPRDLRSIGKSPNTVFSATRTTVKRTTVRVQYTAKKDDIARIKKHNNRPTMSAGDVGLLALRYYLEQKDI